MKNVGRTVFNINCLYVAEMKGEEDTVGEKNQRGERRRLGDRKCVYVLEPAQRAAALISHDGTSEAFL